MIAPGQNHLRVFPCAFLAVLLQACSAPESLRSGTAYSRYSPTLEDARGALRAVPSYDRLETFRSRAEFDRYKRQVREARIRFGFDSVGFRPSQAQGMLVAQNASESCEPGVEECEELAEVSVTGTRVSPKSSITNNQVQGVDEGDIVKSWGRFLIVLQDARLFSLDLGESPGQLRLADRVDAYENAEADAWYDELLIQDNHVLVTGYSYEAGQTEISLFDISQSGTLSLQSRFFIKSEDYYSGGNYASRLVGGKLMLYTPISIIDEDAAFPQWRRWSPREGYTPWKPLLQATDIYRPVDPVVDPVVHAISLCPVLPGKAGDCEVSAVITSWSRELYVSPEAAYLWNVPETEVEFLWRESTPDCNDEVAARQARARPATLFQLGLSDASVTAVRVHGRPPDQFAMEQHSTRFHALVRRLPDSCRFRGPLPLQMLSFSRQLFSDFPQPLADSYWHDMPGVGDGYVSARFSADYLSYGAGRGWWYALRNDAEPRSAHYPLVSVPLRDPSRPQRLSLSNSIERIELLGDNLVTFGATNDRSLGVTTVDLRKSPQVAGHFRIAGARESEGRSHAFNAHVQEDGSAVLGLPTAVITERKNPRGYYEWDDRVQFFTADRTLSLGNAGSLAGDQLPPNPTYECEMSCVDWYGNSRPIFYRERIFALIGSEFVEGQLRDHTIREVARLDLTSNK